MTYVLGGGHEGRDGAAQAGTSSLRPLRYSHSVFTYAISGIRIAYVAMPSPDISRSILRACSGTKLRYKPYHPTRVLVLSPRARGVPGCAGCGVQGRDRSQTPQGPLFSYRSPTRCPVLPYRTGRICLIEFGTTLCHAVMYHATERMVLRKSMGVRIDYGGRAG
eukprot:1778628-Rhodomonas_salina.2